MKKILLATLLIGMMGGCVQNPEPLNANKLRIIGKFNYDDVDYMRVETIDSCEYILINGKQRDQPTITHKGNCKNPIHKGGNK